MNNLSQKTSFNDAELYTLMYHAEHSGAYVAHIRGKNCKTVDEFFREAASCLRFPYYFGANWAAFDECITDLEWLSFNSLMIVVDDYDAFFSKEHQKSTCKKLFDEQLQSTAEYWQNQGISVNVYLNSKTE